MFFSVSVPVYNASKHLDQCIESVITQSEQDFELILVDDGSSDDSLLICRKWERQYPQKIRVVEKQNTGALLTRRRCLKESIGDYIYIIDADDCLVDKDALKTIKDAIEKNNCDMVFFDYQSQNIEKGFNFPFHDKQLFENGDLNLIYCYLFNHSGLNPLWNKVFHRDLVDWNADYSGFCITNGNDLFQSLPIIAAAKRVLYLDMSPYFYRTEDNSQSIVHKFNKSVYYSQKENFYRLIEYSGSWNVPNRQQRLKQRCMKSISTAVYKARLISKADDITRYDYLKMIGEDNLIRDYFIVRGLPLSRKTIVILLRARQYWLLAFALKIIGVQKAG